MVPIPFRSLLPCARAVALLGVALTAAAQPATRSAADPLDPKAQVPQVSYRSAFDGYKGFSDTKLLSWREANDTVARIGGWRVYAREAQPAEPQPTVQPVGPAPAASHSGHKTP